MISTQATPEFLYRYYAYIPKTTIYVYKYVIHTLLSITADRASQTPAGTPDAQRKVRTG